MTDLELLEEIKQAVRNIRVLRYTSSDEELKGFRVHLFEEEWDKLQKLCSTNKQPLSREAIDYLHPAESGWATVQVGPTLKIPSFETEATGADSIREGIDQEILKKMKQAALGKAWDQAVQAVISEDAAILDDLKRQMEAKIPQLLDQATHCPKCEADIYISPTVVSCTKCSWFYVPLQVTNLFEKKDENK